MHVMAATKAGNNVSMEKAALASMLTASKWFGRRKLAKEKKSGLVGRDPTRHAPKYRENDQRIQTAPPSGHTTAKAFGTAAKFGSSTASPVGRHGVADPQLENYFTWASGESTFASNTSTIRTS